MARALESERRDAVFEDRFEVDHADVIAEKEACLSDSATARRVERVPQDLSIASEREPRRSEAT
jgi:O-methyltransferase involved in polyketide biosynthesis